MSIQFFEERLVLAKKMYAELLSCERGDDNLQALASKAASLTLCVQSLEALLMWLHARYGLLTPLGELKITSTIAARLPEHSAPEWQHSKALLCDERFTGLWAWYARLSQPQPLAASAKYSSNIALSNTHNEDAAEANVEALALLLASMAELAAVIRVHSEEY